MRKDFYVFRHGETDLNKQKRWQGSGEDYDLNATGVAQAELAVNKLKEKKLEVIFSSPLKGLCIRQKSSERPSGRKSGQKMICANVFTVMLKES